MGKPDCRWINLVMRTLRKPITGTVREIVRQIVSEEYERPPESVTRTTPLR